MKRGEAAARWLLVLTASLVLLAAGGLAVAIAELSACGGDGGTPHAASGSPQRDYCEANLQLLALLSPAPLIIGMFVPQTRNKGRRLLGLGALGLVLAATPIVAAFILPDA